MGGAGTSRSVRTRTRGVAAACLVALLFAASVALGILRDRRYGETNVESNLLYIQSPALVERIALGYDAILADVYWIRAIQYYGGSRLAGGANRYPLLYPLLDATTTLDPRFGVAYRFGAIFLAEGYPGGPGRPDQAIALLEKGLREEPDKWEYMQDIGFVHYWWLQDYREAARWFERASEIPGAPWFMRSLAAVTLTEGGDRSRSRLLWQQLLETADNDWMRQNAERRLVQLDALDDIDLLEARLGEFRSRFGRHAGSWEELIKAGLLGGVPVDPTGTPYVIDPFGGDVTVSRESPLYPMPSEPRSTRPGLPDA